MNETTSAQNSDLRELDLNEMDSVSGGLQASAFGYTFAMWTNPGNCGTEWALYKGQDLVSIHFAAN